MDPQSQSKGATFRTAAGMLLVGFVVVGCLSAAVYAVRMSRSARAVAAHVPSRYEEPAFPDCVLHEASWYNLSFDESEVTPVKLEKGEYIEALTVAPELWLEARQLLRRGAIRSVYFEGREYNKEGEFLVGRPSPRPTQTWTLIRVDTGSASDHGYRLTGPDGRLRAEGRSLLSHGKYRKDLTATTADVVLGSVTRLEHGQTSASLAEKFEWLSRQMPPSYDGHARIQLSSVGRDERAELTATTISAPDCELLQGRDGLIAVGQARVELPPETNWACLPLPKGDVVTVRLFGNAPVGMSLLRAKLAPIKSAGFAHPSPAAPQQFTYIGLDAARTTLILVTRSAVDGHYFQSRWTLEGLSALLSKPDSGQRAKPNAVANPAATQTGV